MKAMVKNIFENFTRDDIGVVVRNYLRVPVKHMAGWLSWLENLNGI